MGAAMGAPMNSKQNSGRNDPHDVARSVLEEARQQIEIANQLRRRINEQMPKSELNAARHPESHRSWLGKRALKGIGVLVVACIGAAAMVFQLQGDVAKLVTARWEPQLHPASSQAAEGRVPTQSSPSSVQASALKETSPQPAVSAPQAQILLADSAQTVAVPFTEREEQFQSMARGLVAVVEQEMEQLKGSIEQLKASQEALAVQLKAAQEQTTRDNAAIAEQLKASQEQIARLIAKTSEQPPRPRTPALLPRPVTTPTDRPGPKPSPPQARAQPPAAPVRGRPE
jgi:hypothetical protein